MSANVIAIMDGLSGSHTKWVKIALLAGRRKSSFDYTKNSPAVTIVAKVADDLLRDVLHTRSDIVDFCSQSGDHLLRQKVHKVLHSLMKDTKTRSAQLEDRNGYILPTIEFVSETLNGVLDQKESLEYLNLLSDDKREILRNTVYIDSLKESVQMLKAAEKTLKKILV